MVKKTLLSLAIAATVSGLAGCNISSTDDNEYNSTGVTTGINGAEPQIAAPLINPVRGTSFPALASDLLFGFPRDENGAIVNASDADGTLYHADAYTKGADGKATNTLIAVGAEGYNPLFNALNEMDGVSTTAAIDIAMTGSLDISSIKVGQNLLIIPLTYPVTTENPDQDPVKGAAAGDSATPDTANILTAADVKLESIKYADNQKFALRINFNKPLKNATRYLVIMTNGIKNVKGNALARHKEYTTLLSSAETYVNAAATKAVAGLRAQLRVWDASATATLAAVQSTQTSVLSYTFTTGGKLETLVGMGAAPSPGQKPAARTVTIANQAGISVSNLIGDDFAATGATFVAGTIELPYYSQAPFGAYVLDDTNGDGTNDTDVSPTSGYACDLEAATLAGETQAAACGKAKKSAGLVIAGQWIAEKDAIFDLTANPAQKAPSDNVTRLFPYAKKNGDFKAPVLIVQPNAATFPGARPVIIFQHGITGNRTNALAFASMMASKGYATVAIDLPLHGVMPTDLTASEDDEDNIPTFGPLLAQQGVAANATTIGAATLAERHFGLTRNGAKFEPTGVSATDADFNGSGSLMINLAHFQTSRDNLRQAVMDLMNLNASLSAIDTALGGAELDVTEVKFVGHSLGAIVGTTFVTANNAARAKGNTNLNNVTAAVFGMPGGGIPRLLEESKTFGPDIVASIKGGFKLDQDGDSFTKLMYVLQGTFDAVDPLNFAETLKTFPIPYSVIESVNDKVVPNSASRSVLAGTDPLASLMGATQVGVDADFIGLASPHYLIKLKDDNSSHSSIAKPESATDKKAFDTIWNHADSIFKDTPAPALINNDVIEAPASN